ncbi:YbbR-like domain-containing protein [uncultured Winogradskyella sp.]|uniref:YbbR-like domain-containing protein n=1 Tax=uncultured Winogradskyella sp. TaxID=395353 RepID=UPI002612D826|nr:YbbR-like domain-containing protein [uncultured Winogradskyella sp.]
MKNLVSKKTFSTLKKRNIKLFGFFLAAAFLFLMLTKFSESYTQVVSVNLKLTNLEDEIVILNDSSSIAEVTVKARGFNLLKYLFSSTISLDIDAQTEVFKKDKSLFWDVSNNRYRLIQEFGNTVDILSVKPDTIEFHYDVLSSKNVPLILDSDITYAEGYDVVGQLELSQDSVKVIGSRRIIDSIKKIVTEPIVLGDINKDIEASITLLNNNSNKISLVPDKVKINGIVRRFTEGKLNIPIKLINEPLGKKINYFPKNVDVVYYVDLDNYNIIKSENFEVICDFKDFKDENKRYLDLELAKISPLVKRARTLQNRIEFIISD